MTTPAPFDWTQIPVGLEEGDSGHIHVHALTIPGCVATGYGSDEALRAFHAALPEWLLLLADLGEPIPPRDSEIEITVDEWLTSTAEVSAGESHVLFAADRQPLADVDIQHGLAMLGTLRERLIPLIRHAANARLEGNSLAAPDARLILDEMARAQWWILTRLGASPLALVPDRVTSRLDTSMALIVQQLGHLPADARGRVIELDGELWSPRKVLRRLIWTEWALGGAAIRTLDAASRPAV